MTPGVPGALSGGLPMSATVTLPWGKLTATSVRAAQPLQETWLIEKPEALEKLSARLAARSAATRRASERASAHATPEASTATTR